jgi:hypothetical protein
VAGPSAVELKLKIAVFKRVKKLKKLRRRQRLWGAVGALCAVVACSPLLYYLATGSMPAISFDSSLYISGDWAVILGAVIVGLFGSMLFYAQYKRDKDKYDRIRAGAVALLQAGDPVCECKWTPCTCKDDLIKEMHEKYDINLSY